MSLTGLHSLWDKIFSQKLQAVADQGCHLEGSSPCKRSAYRGSYCSKLNATFCLCIQGGIVLLGNARLLQAWSTTRPTPSSGRGWQIWESMWRRCPGTVPTPYSAATAHTDVQACADESFYTGTQPLMLCVVANSPQRLPACRSCYLLLIH
jgi:hypothetical protein